MTVNKARNTTLMVVHNIIETDASVWKRRHCLIGYDTIQDT